METDMYSKTLNKKTIIIAGGTGGIGSATCKLLASYGASIVIVGRADGRPHSLPAELGKHNARITWLSMDLQSSTAWEKLIDSVYEKFHRIDVLVNCVGVLIPGEFKKLSGADVESVISTNFTSVVNGARAVLPVMERQGFGQIIHIGSLGGIVPMPFESLYSATKFAVRGFSLSLNEELRGTGVRVSLISPGPVQTAMLKHEATDDRSTVSFVNKPLATSQVAETVLRVIQHPKRETMLPTLSGRLAQAAGLFTNAFGLLFLLLNVIGRIRLKKYQSKYMRPAPFNLKAISYVSGS